MRVLIKPQFRGGVHAQELPRAAHIIGVEARCLPPEELRTQKHMVCTCDEYE